MKQKLDIILPRLFSIRWEDFKGLTNDMLMQIDPLDNCASLNHTNFIRPKGRWGRLPGNQYIVHIVNSASAVQGTRHINTGGPQLGEFTSLVLGELGEIKEFKYFGRQPIEFQNFHRLVGLNEAFLCALPQRIEQGEVQSILAFLRWFQTKISNSVF